MTVEVNGVAIDTDDWPSAELAAVHELLRQRAVTLGLLAPNAADQAEISAAIEQLLAQEVPTPLAGETELLRYYEAHQSEFRTGDLVFARHILFQIAPGVPVNALRVIAERTLGEVLSNPDSFGDRARELSNCPSNLFGGNLGQIGRGDTVPEFEAALFADNSIGILPALVKTRYGFHIVTIDHRIMGQSVPFDVARDRIAERLSVAAQRVALRQYTAILAGQASLRGVDLGAAPTPLVQ